MVKIKNKILVALDPELRSIRKVIERTLASSALPIHLQDGLDNIFKKRLETHARALKMSFWEDHFEWKSLVDYPEISGTILDFGCGSGHLDVMLARNGKRVHGIDLNTVGIGIAEHLKTKEDDAVKKRLSFRVVDITKELPDGERFDSAWSAHVFEHIADPAPIFDGLVKWLKQGAYMLISVPLGYAYDDPGHVNHFKNADQLKKYLSNYVDITRIDISEQYQVIKALCRFP